MQFFVKFLKALRDPYKHPLVMVSCLALGGITLVGCIAILTVAAVRIWGGQ